MPAGTVVASYLATLAGNLGFTASQTMPGPSGGASTSTTTFSIPQTDTYTIKVQALDGSNNAVGSAATSAPFSATVTPPPVNVVLPTSVTVTVS